MDEFTRVLTLTRLLLVGRVFLMFSGQVYSDMIDVTNLVGSLLENPSEKYYLFPVGNVLGEVKNVYYTTEMPLEEFLLKRLEKVLNTLDGIWVKLNSSKKGTKNLPKIILGLRIQQNFTFNELNVSTSIFDAEENSKLAQAVTRLLGIVLDYTDFPCSSNMSFGTGNGDPFFEQYNFRVLLQDFKVKVLKGILQVHQMGISNSVDQIGCLHLIDHFRPADFVILNFWPSIENLVLSDWLFHKHLGNIATAHASSLWSFNFGDFEQTFYHFESRNWKTNVSEGDSLRMEKYQKYLLNYTLTWASKPKKLVIIDPFARDKDAAATLEVNSFDSTRMTPKWKLYSTEKIPLLESIKVVSSAFSKIAASQITPWKYLVECWTRHHNSGASQKQNIVCGSPSLWGQQKLNITLMIFHQEYVEFISKFLTQFELNDIILDNLVLSSSKHYFDFEQAENLRYAEAFQKLATRRKVSCTIFSDFSIPPSDKQISPENLQMWRCDQMLRLKIVNTVIYDVEIKLGEMMLNNFDYKYVSQMFSHLEEFDKVIKDYSKNVTGDNLLYQFDFTSRTTGEQILAPLLLGPNFFSRTVSGLYCSDKALIINSLIETFGSWADVHNVNAIMGMQQFRENVWWTVLKLPTGLTPSPNGETFHTVARNIPPTMQNSIKIDPCLKKSIDISSRIAIQDKLIGTFVDLSVEEFHIDELEVMIRLVFFKFKVIELRMKANVELVEKLKQVFQSIKETGFVRDKARSGESTRVYLGITWTVDMPPVYVNMIADLGFLVNDISSVNLIGIHLIKENMTRMRKDALQGMENTLKQKGAENINLGISLTNCTSEINYLLAYSTLQVPSQLKYILCQEFEYASSTNTTHMEELLDGHLVLEKTFRKVLPKLERVFFHLQLTTAESELGNYKSLDFLRFITDLNGFAEGYKIPYFIPAFDNAKTLTSGWWRIENCSDLATASSYFEKEAEHLQTETWKPTPKEIPNRSISSPSMAKWVIALISTLGVCFILLTFFAVVQSYRVRRKQMFLTKAEVEEFLEGKKAEEIEEHPSSPQDHGFEAMKFNEDFSIGKEEIILDSKNILGAGNFGTVYKATVRGESVAVKAPKAGCSKETFKSLLTEVKILCYIGEHVNVIKFVGAYVQEISRGLIFIATIICNNGSLQGYLREIQRDLRNNGNGEMEMVQVDIYELLQFSKEIASGMAYIASKKVVHGDLSTRNVLLDENNRCKIADFGLARKLYEVQKYVKKSQEPLPWRWLAFESLKMMEFTTKSDVWSYGVTLWEIFTLGDIPYPGVNWSTQFINELGNGMRMTKPGLATPQIFSKMFDCWKMTPECRPSFEELKGFFIELTSVDYTVLAEYYLD